MGWRSRGWEPSAPRGSCGFSGAPTACLWLYLPEDRKSELPAFPAHAGTFLTQHPHLSAPSGELFLESTNSTRALSASPGPGHMHMLPTCFVSLAKVYPPPSHIPFWEEGLLHIPGRAGTSHALPQPVLHFFLLCTPPSPSLRHHLIVSLTECVCAPDSVLRTHNHRLVWRYSMPEGLCYYYPYFIQQERRFRECK